MKVTEKMIRDAIRAINEHGCPDCGGDFAEIRAFGKRALFCKNCGKRAVDPNAPRSQA